MEIVLAIVVGVLYTVSVYLMLRRSILKFIIGLIFMSNATNLLVFLSAGLVPGSPDFVKPEVWPPRQWPTHCRRLLCLRQ